jgi:hypothetical protein
MTDDNCHGKGRKIVNNEIAIQQKAADATNQVAPSQRVSTGGASFPPRSEGLRPGFNRYIYENLLVHIEGQTESWNRRAVREPNPEAAHALWLKAEGLGYALRLLYAFEPEFQELVECASRAAADRHSNKGPR